MVVTTMAATIVWTVVFGGCRRADTNADQSASPASEASGTSASAVESTPAPAPVQEPARTARIPVELLFRPRVGPVASSARIFLVAASSQNANFAQEIVEQRALWRDAGFAADEIACYYTVPYREEFDADREQFLALAPQLTDCHAASVKLLSEHLARATQGGFLYLYVTAHGQRPISQQLAAAAPDDPSYERLLRQAVLSPMAGPRRATRT